MSPATIPPMEQGWAAQALDRAMWTSSAAGLGVWQLVVGIIVASAVSGPGLPLLVAHAVFAAVAIWTATGRRGLSRAAYFHVLFALLTLDLVLADDLLTGAVVCSTFVIVVTPFLVMPRRTAVLITSGWVTAASLSLVQWGRLEDRLVVAIALPAICYALAADQLVARLRRFADQADVDATAAAREHEQLVRARAAARTSAEYVRTLHDTVINTLAFLASERAAVADPRAVRERCAQDVRVLRTLDTGAHAGQAYDVDGVARRTSLTVEWTGASPTERRALLAELGQARGSAVSAIVGELVQNVEKHAGVDRVTIDVAADDAAVLLTVADQGRGISPGGQRSQGLAGSVLARAAEHGIEVSVTSAPGSGTRVRLRCPRGSSAPEVDEAAAEATDESVGIDAVRGRILRAGTWGWCVAVSAASLLAGMVGTRSPATVGSSLLVAVLAATAWMGSRGRPVLPDRLALVVAAGVPVAFVLGFVGAASSSGDPAFWQGIGLTPLLVVLLTTTRTRVPLVLAVLALMAAALVAAVSARTSSPAMAGVALVNAATQLGQLFIWVIFSKVLVDIGDRAAASRRDVLRDRADRARLDAATATQRLWRQARADAAEALLDDVATGRKAADDPDLQRRASAEEHVLRQLLQLGSDLVHLGPCLALQIGRSRQHEAYLSVRVGSRDLPDERAAAAVDRVLTGLLEAAEVGEEYVVAYFGEEADAAVTVVGPAGFASRRATEGAADGECRLRVTTVVSQDLVEIWPPVPPAVEALSPA